MEATTVATSKRSFIVKQAAWKLKVAFTIYAFTIQNNFLFQEFVEKIKLYEPSF